MDYKFKLLKIHCAGCALALEQNINQVDGVNAELSFVTKVLKLKINTENPTETLAKVKSVINKFDHSIEIINYEDSEDIIIKEKKEKEFKIIKLSIAISIMLINCLMPDCFSKTFIFFLDYLLVSYNILISAVRNLFNKKFFDENFLMTIASIGAFVIGKYIEAVSVMILYGVGEILEEQAIGSSRRTISSLLAIKQPYANLVTDDGEEKVLLSEVNVGSIIRIKPGERVPLDSVVIEGTSYLDVSALTGETKEQIITKGSKILSGSINGASVILAKVEKIEKDSVISKVVDMVEKATETKAKSEKFISKFSKYYTPTVIFLAIIIMFLPPIIVGFDNFSTFAYRSLCFLVVSCPCALVISVPLTYFASIGSFARSGIIVKGAIYLETLAKVDTVIFDKTGTLTQGNFEITEIVPNNDRTSDDLLEIVAYAESFSNHKIAKSILEKYNATCKKTINSAWINDYTEIPGKGIKANIFMQDTIVGNAKFLKSNGIQFFEISRPGTVLYVSIDNEYAGYIVIGDKIKKDSRLAIRKLKNEKIKEICICSGDEKNAVKVIANKLGINDYYFGLLPEDKVSIITDKIQENKIVAFIGDGINDAPSLANANIGISMGEFGSDIAVESSDIVIMTDEPSKVAYSIKKAKKTHKIVLENIIGSIGIKIAILFLIGFGFSGMWLAVFADVGVNILAVINSLRAMLK